MMRYALLMNYSEPGEGDVDPQVMQDTMTAMGVFARALADAGVLRVAQVLQPTTSTKTVSVRTGRPQVQDGPFADTREALGGFFVIDVANEAAAVDWAAQCPMAKFGTIEVRPGATHFENGSWNH